jgi:hypothetical protein
VSLIQFPGKAVGNKKRDVIAVSGWKGSGKDTVAEFLVKEYGYKRLSFADKLKDLVSTQYSIPREWLDDRVMKETPLTSPPHCYPVIPSDSFALNIHYMLRNELSSGYWTPRAICILEGSLKRSVHSNYWVRSVVEEITSAPNQDYVISDMRYISEADIIRKMITNARLIRIQREDNIATQDPSERDLDNYKFDIYLPNKSTVPALHTNINAIVSTRGII